MQEMHGVWKGMYKEAAYKCVIDVFPFLPVELTPISIIFDVDCDTCSLTPSAASSSGTTTTASISPDISTSDRNSIGFLLNFAGEADFMREFPKDNTVSPPKRHAEEFPNPITTQNGSGYISASTAQFRRVPSHASHIKMPRESSLDIFLSNLDLGTFECQTNNYQTAPESAMQPGHGLLLLDRAALEQMALDIRAKLESTVVTMNLPNAPSKELFGAIQVIDARHIVTWVKLYFRHFHKHGPIVHEASFNPATVALPLVLAIMTIGAMASFPEGLN